MVTKQESWLCLLWLQTIFVSMYVMTVYAHGPCWGCDLADILTRTSDTQVAVSC